MSLLADTTQPHSAGASAGPLWLARHAQPLIGAGVCYGATDMPADMRGTSTSAVDLARELPLGTCVAFSPLRRCTQLALELLRLRPDLSLASDVRLVEMNFGHWEGWRWDEIPKNEIDQWTAQFGSWRFGGCETVQELMDRVAGAWRDALTMGGPRLWITHAGVIRAAMLLSCGITVIERAEQWPVEVLEFGRCVRLL